MSNHAGVVGEHRLLRRKRKALLNSADLRLGTDVRRRERYHTVAHMAVVVALLCLAAANLHLRWTFVEMEDGVLWANVAGDVVAKEIVPDSPGARAGIRRGDVLVAVDRREILTTEEVTAALHAARADTH